MADRLAARAARPRARRVTKDAGLRAVVVELLDKRWSPEQVARELRERFPDQRQRRLCTESVYQASYDTDVEVSWPAKRRRRRRVQGRERRGRLSEMTMIAERPPDVEDRVQVEPWEADCLMGAGNRSAIGTSVERTIGSVILVHVPKQQPNAQAIRDGVSASLWQLPPQLRRTLT